MVKNTVLGSKWNMCVAMIGLKNIWEEVERTGNLLLHDEWELRQKRLVMFTMALSLPSLPAL